VLNIDVDANGQGVQISNLTAPVEVDVYGNNCDVYATSTSTIDLSLEGNGNMVQMSAGTFIALDVAGNGNTVHLLGAVTGGSMVGNNNDVRVEGVITPVESVVYDVNGTNNAFLINGGNCTAVNKTGSGNTCASTTETVTVGEIPCTVTTGSSINEQCSTSAGFAIVSFHGRFMTVTAAASAFVAAMLYEMS